MDNKSYLDILLETLKDLENTIKEILKPYLDSCFIEIKEEKDNEK